MSWIGEYFTQLVTLLIACVGIISTYFRLKFSIRSNARQIESLDTALTKQSAQFEKTYEAFREECKACRQEVKEHLKDPDVHREMQLEEFRFETLEKTLSELKIDLSKGIEATEARVCARLDRVELAIRNGGKA